MARAGFREDWTGSAPAGDALDPRERFVQAAAQVRAPLDLLTRLTNAREPDVEAVTKTRFELVRAERQRRIETNAIVGASAAITALIDLRAPYDVRLRRQVGDWPATRLTSDWAGYCSASREVQALLRRMLMEEERWLRLRYPLAA